VKTVNIMILMKNGIILATSSSCGHGFPVVRDRGIELDPNPEL